MKSLLHRFLVDNSGVTVIEYSLIGGLVSLALFTAAIKLGGKIDETYRAVATAVVNTTLRP